MESMLFRAKSVNGLGTEKSEWVKGAHVHYDDVLDNGKDDCDYIVLPHDGTCFPFIKVDPSTLGMYSGFDDKNETPVFSGDVVELVNEIGETIRAECRYGTFVRGMDSGAKCFITGFAFIVDGFPTFPIVKNYLGVSDNEIFEVIGNIHDDPDILAMGVLTV